MALLTLEAVAAGLMLHVGGRLMLGIWPAMPFLARLGALIAVAGGIVGFILSIHFFRCLGTILRPLRRGAFLAYGIAGSILCCYLGLEAFIWARFEVLWIVLFAAGLAVIGITVSRVLEPTRRKSPSVIPERPLPQETGQKLLVIGIDSASWDIVSSLMDRGLIPNIKSIAEKGVCGALNTIRPTWSPVVWTSIATGKLPVRHGVIDFVTRFLPGAKKGVQLVLPRGLGIRKGFHWLHKLGLVTAKPVGSTERVSPAFWEIADFCGQSAAVVGWHATSPPDPINGFMVSDLVLSGQIPVSTDNAVLTHPAELLDDVVRLRPSIDDLDELTHGLFRKALQKGCDANEKKALEIGIVEDSWAVNITLDLLRRSSCRVVSVLLYNLDKIQHLFWKYYRPRNADSMVRRGSSRLKHSVIENYYVYLDSLVGKLKQVAGKEFDIMVMSDHGMRSASRWTEFRTKHSGSHEDSPPGVFIAGGPAVADSVSLKGARVVDIAPTMHAILGWPLAKDIDGTVLAEALRPGFLSRFPLRWVESNDDLKLRTRVRPIGEETAALMERLQALGYLD